MSYGSVPAPGTLASPTLSHRPKRPSVLRKWWFWVIVAIGVLVIWVAGSALLAGRKLSNDAVAHFHQELNAGSFDQIWQAADEGFRRGGTREQLLAVLLMVHTKLGDANSSTLFNIQVNANPNGTFIVAAYNTRFAKAPAVEKFTWKKTGGVLKLYGYNVNSDALQDK